MEEIGSKCFEFHSRKGNGRRLASAQALRPQKRAFKLPNNQITQLPNCLGVSGFASLIDVSNGRLIDQQVSAAGTSQLNTVLVVPLDQALDLVAIFQDHHD